MLWVCFTRARSGENVTLSFGAVSDLAGNKDDQETHTDISPMQGALEDLRCVCSDADELQILDLSPSLLASAFLPLQELACCQRHTESHYFTTDYKNWQRNRCVCAVPHVRLQRTYVSN